MEAASFLIFDKAMYKFQMIDPDSYFVHHMSMFEHHLHKKYDLETSRNKTLIMSQAAFHGECDHVKLNDRREFMAMVPFYGGLPPNVTKAAHSRPGGKGVSLEVKSLGQGNSLMDAGTKALQAMATLCSTLQYFGQAVVTVARTEDRKIILDMVSLPASLSPLLSFSSLEVSPVLRLESSWIEFGLKSKSGFMWFSSR